MHYILFLAITVFFSCSEMGKNSNSGQNADASVAEAAKPASDTLAMKFSFLRNLPLKSAPFRDSTNFDNFKFSALLSQEQQYRFGLATLVSPYDLKDISSSEMRYRVAQSEQFITVVFTTQVGEHELRTDLANFDQSFRLIDFKTIAYDEIAEGCLQKTGYVTGDKIIIYEANYCDEDTGVLEKSWMIEGTGKLKEVH